MSPSGHHRAVAIVLVALIAATALRLQKHSDSSDRVANGNVESLESVDSRRDHRDEHAAPRVVFINRATASELEALPGVGPSLASRIVEHRARYGEIRSPSDLDRVRGVGPALLRRLSPLLRFDSQIHGPARTDTDAEHVRETAVQEAR